MFTMIFFRPSFSALRTLLLALVLSVGAAQGVKAQSALVGEDYKKVNQLLNSKNLTAAQQAADTYLANNPQDPQMRLLKSRILIAQDNIAEARNVLLLLTQEYPEIAEPHNNLAVLYAQAGELDMARVSLENALRVNPHYAMALQNLGDVYRRIAHDHYSRALALQPGNRALQEKIKTVQ
ncbi:MAG: tetratricopeptide repeat protein [Brachymonas sp.]|nr:tetratricopeptide repeat protein [Brachymonas sp.]